MHKRSKIGEYAPSLEGTFAITSAASDGNELNVVCNSTEVLHDFLCTLADLTHIDDQSCLSDYPLYSILTYITSLLHALYSDHIIL